MNTNGLHGLWLVFLLTTVSFGQTPSANEGFPGSTTEEPRFPGGTKALRAFLHQTVVYPDSAKQSGVRGKVFLSFLIDEEGCVSDIQVLKGLSTDCDAEALRVINLLPRWTPGKESGKPVRVKYNLPVEFGL